MEELMPFKVELVGLEEGGKTRLEALKRRFKDSHIHGPWFRPTGKLQAYLDDLEPLSVSSQTKRVSLDLSVRDYVRLDEAVKARNVTKSKFLRQAIRFFLAIDRYHAQGYLIQAIRDGDLIQFPKLEDPRS